MVGMLSPVFELVVRVSTVDVSVDVSLVAGAVGGRAGTSTGGVAAGGGAGAGLELFEPKHMGLACRYVHARPTGWGSTG